MTIEEIDLFLNQNADDKNRDFASSLIPDAKMLGVRLPIMRNFAKKLAKDNWEEYFINAPEVYTEHIMLKGFLLGHIKDINTLLKYLKLYIPKIDNWAVCDSPLTSLKLIKKHQAQVWDFLAPYITDKREFYARTAAILLMCFFIDEKYINKTLKALEQIKADGYYRQMGVAWAISVCYIKFPIETEVFLNNNTLDDFTHNKAISKIRESFRVSKENKTRLNSLKRKKSAI